MSHAWWGCFGWMCFLMHDEKKLPEVSLLLCCPGYCIMLPYLYTQKGDGPVVEACYRRHSGAHQLFDSSISVSLQLLPPPHVTTANTPRLPTRPDTPEGPLRAGNTIDAPFEPGRLIDLLSGPAHSRQQTPGSSQHTTDGRAHMTK